MQDRIEKVVELAAPVARVWRALTNHEEFGAWFRVDLEGPFVLGATSLGVTTYPGYEGMRWEANVVAMACTQPGSATQSSSVKARISPRASRIARFLAQSRPGRGSRT